MAEKEKPELVYLQFYKGLMFNKRTIKKKDNRGNPITLVSIGFPSSSKYYGYYISVNSNFVKDNPYNEKMASYSFCKDAKVTIYQYIKENNKHYTKELKISVAEMIEEFNLWKNKNKNEIFGNLAKRKVDDYYEKQNNAENI